MQQTAFVSGLLKGRILAGKGRAAASVVANEAQASTIGGPGSTRNDMFHRPGSHDGRGVEGEGRRTRREQRQ